MTDLSIYFAFPGDLETPTGGYRYDRRLIGELRRMGIKVKTVALPQCSGMLDQQILSSVQQTLAAIPDQAVVVIDGLAFGVLDDLAVAEAQRLQLVALCHHPLALETGLDERRRQALMVSERRALNCARATVVTSENTRQILIDQFAVSAERISVALPGTDRVPFAPGDGDPIRLLTVASLTRRKAHDILINSLAPLKSLPWQARFGGGHDFDPSWARILQEQVNTLELSQRIHFGVRRSPGGRITGARGTFRRRAGRGARSGRPAGGPGRYSGINRSPAADTDQQPITSAPASRCQESGRDTAFLD